MSLEPAEGAADIDTRPDVYALGVLLYELKTGAPWFERVALRAEGYARVRQIIREVTPGYWSPGSAPLATATVVQRPSATKPRTRRASRLSY